MSGAGLEQLDQALFGYDDGHRQLASSVKLPSHDLFQLSSVSDLAGGTILGTEESYITGIPLAESKRYALIRTWGAPEMPRPGCVWSHVLLIDFRLLAVQGSLAILLSQFKHPKATERSAYSKPIMVDSGSDTVSKASPALVHSILRSYYNLETTVLPQSGAASEREASIIAVWSQQWPKLRIAFSFRTAVISEKRRGDTGFDVRVGGEAPPNYPGDSSLAEDAWLDEAAADALSLRGTPLRRFLWRYGRDVVNPRRNFSRLTQIYMDASNANVKSLDLVHEVLDAFSSPNDAMVLKRDLLGLNVQSQPMIPSLSPPDFFALMSTKSGLNFSDEDIQLRIEQVSKGDVAAIAKTLSDDVIVGLNGWYPRIFDRIVTVSDKSTVLDEKIPPNMRKDILRARPDLIDEKIAALLSDNVISDLVLAHGDDAIGRTIAVDVVGRDFRYNADRLLLAAPLSIGHAAIVRASAGALNRSWERALSYNASRLPISQLLKAQDSSSGLFAAIGLLHIVPRGGLPATEWLDCLQRAQDDLQGDRRVIFYSFLIVVALVAADAPNWQLFSKALPEIRRPLLDAHLPVSAYNLLNYELPKFRTAQYWDLNKRIILTMAQFARHSPVQADLKALGFSDDDFDVLYNGLQEEENKTSNPYWWW